MNDYIININKIMRSEFNNILALYDNEVQISSIYITVEI